MTQAENLRPLTLAESVCLIRLSVLIKREDPDMAELVRRIAGGDDSAMPAFHDRLNVCGRPDLADKLRQLVTGGRA